MAVPANPNVPHIAQPIAELRALTDVVGTLRQGVESLGGHRGRQLDRAVTFNDLIALGLVSAADIQGKLQGLP